MQIVPLWLDPRHRLALEKRDAWVTLGRFLGERHPSASLAVGAAGKIPYFSRAYTIDMLGLTEPTIARTQAHGFSPGHSKWDAVYVLSRQPDVICAGVRSNLDLGLGLKRALWMRAGYELRYAVRGDQVRDISASSESEQRALVQRGFSFACLGRIERAASTNEPVSS